MISFEIYREVREYLESRITLHQLENRLLPFMPGILSKPHSDNANIVSAIELATVDFDNKILSELEAREYIDRIFRKYETSVVSLIDREVEISTGTSSVIGSRVGIDATTSVIRLESVLL